MKAVNTPFVKTYNELGEINNFPAGGYVGLNVSENRSTRRLDSNITSTRKFNNRGNNTVFVNKQLKLRVYNQQILNSDGTVLKTITHYTK